MTDNLLTTHAVLRMSQRGIRPDDLEMIGLVGTQLTEGPMVLRRDAQEFERLAKKAIDHVWKLAGKRCVTDGRTIITVFHAERSEQRRILRRDRK